MASFALIGAAGYVAPRHMRAIQAIGGDLRVAFDPRDSVGIIDSYFPDAHFFTEFERFDRHIDKLRRHGEKIDFMSVCSPNYLHDAHCRFAMRSGADVICEKPLVLNPWNIDGLEEIEQETGHKISCILQLRLHPAIRALKRKVDESSKNGFLVDLTYVTARGRWYLASWKGDEAKSGGIATNIGVHFFDMLTYVFGPPTMNVVHCREPERAAGFIVCGKASIRWYLSVRRMDAPMKEGKQPTSYRSITVDGEEVDYSDGFTDLHVASYKEIAAGNRFSVSAARPAIEIVSAIRNAPIERGRGELHPLIAGYSRP
jgi:UDP-N-acetyl-2-amino-2-deoxyglucuronate dehydrogenase